MRDYETGWDRTDRLLISLLNAMEIQDDPVIKKQCQDMIEKITSPDMKYFMTEMTQEEFDEKRDNHDIVPLKP